MKQAIKKLLPKNRFARSVSVLAGGTAAGQGIVVLSSPLLTRLYTPDDFGALAVFVSILGILASVSSLRYLHAIPLPDREEDGAKVVLLSLLVILLITMICTIVVLFFHQSIAHILNIPLLSNYLWLLPPGLLLVGVYQVFTFWAIREKSFTAIARTKLIQSLSMVAVQLGGHMIGPLALLIGRVFGQAAGVTTLGSLTVKDRWSLFKKIRLPDLYWAATRYKRFPLYSTWGAAFNSAGQELSPLFFAAFFSASAAGVYMLAHRVLAMPMTLIGRAVADVFFSQAPEARRNDMLAPLVAGIHEKLAHIAMPPTLLLILVGPELFSLVFGENWRQAGQFAQWMAPWIYLMFVTSPLSRLYVVLEKQAQGMFFDASLFSTRLLALLIGAYYQNIILAVALFSLAGVLCYAGFLIWIMRTSGSSWTTLFVPAAHSLIWSIALLLPLIIANFMGYEIILWTLMLSLTVILIAIRYVFLMKKAWKSA